MVKNLPAMWEAWVRFLGWEDPLEKGMATHSSIQAWRIPMDRGAWPDTVHVVAKSWTWLSDLQAHCSVTKLCLTLCDPLDCSTPGFPVFHYVLEFAPTHVHWFSDAIRPSHSLSPPFPLELSLSQHQGLFQWTCSSYQVAKVLELQHWSFQWILGLISFRIDWFDLAGQGTLKSLLQHHNFESVNFSALILLSGPTLDLVKDRNLQLQGTKWTLSRINTKFRKLLCFFQLHGVTCLLELRKELFITF